MVTGTWFQNKVSYPLWSGSWVFYINKKQHYGYILKEYKMGFEFRQWEARLEKQEFGKHNEEKVFEKYKGTECIEY